MYRWSPSVEPSVCANSSGACQRGRGRDVTKALFPKVRAQRGRRRRDEPSGTVTSRLRVTLKLLRHQQTADQGEGLASVSSSLSHRLSSDEPVTRVFTSLVKVQAFSPFALASVGLWGD